MNPYRSHTCSQLRCSDVGRRVRLCGWVHRKRDHGGLLFIDLRDDHGLTQCVALPDSRGFAVAEQVRVESVIGVTGEIVQRSEETVNTDLETGEVELRIDTIDIVSAAAELPLPVFGEPEYPEDIRLTYRYLDLRRSTLHANIKLRSAVIWSLRRRMEALGFTEFQTPILTASSPEGARDFLVPSRLHRGQFYALPQAPQLFKQLVMISGFERYFQIAPCFRDEDARADRSPGEFYQLDVEMAFVTQDEVLDTIEPVMTGLFDEFAPGRRVSEVPRIAYADTMLRYGTDKPDLRNPIECSDVSDVFMRADVEFRAFADIVGGGGVVRVIPAPGASVRPRSFFDKLNQWARSAMDAAGLGYVILSEQDGVLCGKGPIAKFLPGEAIGVMAERARAGAGDVLFFAAGKKSEAEKLQAAARQRIAEELDLIDTEAFAFCWIVDYPCFAWDETEGRIDFSHNPFSMPQSGVEALASASGDKDLLSILAWQYDLVCNGVELSSGAIRNHDPELLIGMFEAVGWQRSDIEANFSGLISALRHGAPPHGGIAPGIDRIVMLLAGTDNIRDVTLFPMNQRARDLMMGAPAGVSGQQLADLGLCQIPEDQDS